MDEIRYGKGFTSIHREIREKRKTTQDIERPIPITTWRRNCTVGPISVDDKNDDKQRKKATNKGKKGKKHKS
jgi:hypothetical protein